MLFSQENRCNGSNYTLHIDQRGHYVGGAVESRKLFYDIPREVFNDNEIYTYFFKVDSPSQSFKTSSSTLSEHVVHVLYPHVSPDAQRPIWAMEPVMLTDQLLS